MMIANEPSFPVIPVSTWSEYRDLVDGPRFRSWGFRGQSDASWPLFSSLSRYLLYSKVHPDAWPGQEARILRIFRRKAHLFLQHVPDERDSFQWLALMQHHGAPTRLLDVTWSPYVALFFAIEHGSSTAAVWAFNAAALDRDVLWRDARGTQDRPRTSTWVYGSFERHFLRNNNVLVALGEPKIMNQRLIAQSGTFLIPGVLERPIEAILSAYPDADQCLAKIELDVAAMRESAMRGLYSMNLTHATLFPDLDGLARSMAYELEYHWAFNPRTMQANTGYPPPQELWFWDSDDFKPFG